MCKISIVMPIYNVEKYLRKCLNSILDQTFKDYEIIMVDDGSTDGSGAICDEFAEKDSRFHAYHKKNEGVSIARNFGIEKASGEYFAFFDGDDYVEPECLEEVYTKAVEEEADSVIYGYYLTENDKVIETHLPGFEKSVYEEEEIIEQVIPCFVGVSYKDIEQWIAGKKGVFKKENTALWHQLVRADIIRNNNIRFDPRLKVGEDTCFTTEYLSASSKCCVIEKCYYHLVVRSTSTIFTYEKNPMAILAGKKALLIGRRELTERIKKRTGHDIEELWYGTVVMSAIQLALQLSHPIKGKSYRERYQCWKGYLTERETVRAIEGLKLKNGSLKSVPFRMLKNHWYGLIFGCGRLAQLLPYKFKR